MNGFVAAFTLEVRGGQGQPASLRFESGKKIGPMSFGSKSQWVVAGPGVAEMHGRLVFDGVQLLLQSASPSYPLRVNGSPVSGAWVPVVPPAQIELGGVVLAYGIVDNEKTIMAPNPTMPSRPPSIDDATRVGFLVDPALEFAGASRSPSSPPGKGDDATRPKFLFQDDQKTLAINPSGSGPYAAFPTTPLAPPPPVLQVPAPSAGERTRMGSSPGILNLAPPVVAPPPPAQNPARALATQFAAQWRTLSLPKKASFILLPFAAVIFIVGSNKSEEVRTMRANATPMTSAAPSAKPSASAAPSATPAVAPIPVPVTSSSSNRTPERQAVDSVVAGALGDAVNRYGALARLHPEQPVYKEAERILRAKLDAGTH